MYNWFGNAGPSGNAPIATDGNGVPTPLQRIRSELPHLDLTGRVFDKDQIKEARGGYADVFVGYVSSECLRYRGPMRARQGRAKVAIKRLQIRLDKSARFAKWIEREMKIWSRLNHPNILPFLGYMFEKNWPALISEWMDNGTLREFMEQAAIDVLHLARGIAEGMKYMHDKNFVHSDLKSDNVLIGKHFQPLICDFGISRMLDPTQSGYVSTTCTDSPRGTIRWMAPELLASEEDVEANHSKETDVWAYGMVLYEMISKKVPYAHLRSDPQVIIAIGRGQLPSLLDFSDVMTQSSSLPPNAYPQICRICEECWAKSPEKRLTMPEISRILALVFDGMQESQATITVNMLNQSHEGLVEMNQQIHNAAPQAHPSQVSQWLFKVPTDSKLVPSKSWQAVLPPLVSTEQQRMPQGVLPQRRKPATHARPIFEYDQTFLHSVDFNEYTPSNFFIEYWPRECFFCQRTFPDAAAFMNHHCRTRPSVYIPETENDLATLRENLRPARGTYHNADVETGQQMFSGNAQSRNDPPQVSSSRMIGVDLPLSYM
ncbi:hypothetical protein ACEPAH_9029 [Sanghuangporus vaninii]